MKTKIAIAIAAIAGAHAPMSTAALVEGASNSDIVTFVNGLDTRTSDAFAKAEEGNLIRVEHDSRMNELSDRNYKSEVLGGSAIHYDGDKVVKTDTDLTDTVTGAVMHDRNGNALKVRKLETGSDSITLRGDSGTAIHNVKAGDAPNDAVNVSQLNKVDQVAKAAQANSNSNATAIGQTNNKVKTLEGNIKAVGNTAASAALAASGADAKAVTASKIGNEAKHDASSAMAVGADAKGTANIAKNHADKLEVSKVDVSTFEADQRRQDAAAQENKDRLNGVDETLVAHGQAINSTNGRIDTVSSTLTTETNNLWKDKASQKDVDNVTANLQGQVDTKADKADVDKVSKAANDANESSSLANGGVARLDSEKASHDEVVQASSSTLSSANAYTDESRESSRVYSEQVAASWGRHAMEYADYRDDVTLSEAKSYTDAKYDAVSQRQDSMERKQKDNQREYRGGIAATAAMANIPTARDIGRLSIGVGVGSFASANAVAVGASYRINERTTVKGSFSSTGSQHVAGAGVAYEF